MSNQHNMKDQHLSTKDPIVCSRQNHPYKNEHAWKAQRCVMAVLSSHHQHPRVTNKPFTWTPHPDTFQAVLLVLCVFDLTFFCYYLFNYELDRQHTISDTLFGDGEYRAVLTCLLACRLARKSRKFIVNYCKFTANFGIFRQ